MDGRDDALQRAYRFLGHRDRSVAEVRAHLEAKGVEPEAVEAAVAELTEQGYLDDARFARRFVADKRELDSWGATRIERRLRELGVASDEIASALGDGGSDELALAVGLLERRYAAPLADDRACQRALAMLVRKGYELELAYDAVRAFGTRGSLARSSG